MLNLISPEYIQKAGLIKVNSAGGVLVASVIVVIRLKFIYLYTILTISAFIITTSTKKFFIN